MTSITIGSSMPDIASMNVGQIRTELKAYSPGTASEVNSTPEFLERHAQLWAKLDRLVAAWLRQIKAQAQKEATAIGPLGGHSSDGDR
jgi:hypothetical protein